MEEYNEEIIPAFDALKIETFEPILMPHHHWHGHIEFNYIYKGQMTYLFNGYKVVVPPNQFVLFWAAIPHRTTHIKHETPHRAQICNIYIPLDEFLFWPKLSALRNELLSGAIIALKATEQDLNRIKIWNADFASANKELKEIMLLEIQIMLRRAMLEKRDNLLAHIYSDKQSLASSALKAQNTHNHIVKMLQYVHKNYRQNITTQNIADEIGFHKHYANKIFQSLLHMSIKKYINHLRLYHAKQMLLETHLPVATVAFEAGFGSVSQFYKIFEKEYKTPPKKFIKRAN